MAQHAGEERTVNLADELAPHLGLVGGYAAELDLVGGLDPGQELADLELDRCTLTGAVLSGARLARCTFTEVTFRRCDLTTLDLSDSRFLGCTFEGCRMLGLSWAAADTAGVLHPNRFVDCRLDDATFLAADVTGWTFERCRLHRADFESTVMARAELTGCDLTGARFARTDLRGAGLVDSYGWVLDPRENRVTGLRVSLDGIEGLLAPLGVELA